MVLLRYLDDLGDAALLQIGVTYGDMSLEGLRNPEIRCAAVLFMAINFQSEARAKRNLLSRVTFFSTAILVPG